MIPLPSAIYIYAAVAIGAAAAGGTTAWKVQSWRYGEQIAAIKTAQDKALISAIEGARTIESARFKGVQDAQTAAAQRAIAAQADARNARTALERLRNTVSASSSSMPGDTAAACGKRADTANLILSECASTLVQMAGDADAQAGAVKLLQDAWPR